jgi:hypothetical protein
VRLRIAVGVAVFVVASGCERPDGGETTNTVARPAESLPARTGTMGGPDQAVVAEFQRRLDDYMAVQNQLEDTLDDPPEDATPQQIDAHQRALAALVQKARSDAKPGEVFSPHMQAFVRGVVGRVFEGPDGKALRATIAEENPAGTPVRINGRYPDAVPMSTMPPDILAALPQLPEELEYRFVGDRLILLDTKTHVIVDYVDDVLPG